MAACHYLFTSDTRSIILLLIVNFITMGIFKLLNCFQSTSRSKSQAHHSVFNDKPLLNFVDIPLHPSPSSSQKHQKKISSNSIEPTISPSKSLRKLFRLTKVEMLEDEYNEPLRALPDSLNEFQCCQLLRTELSLYKVKYISEGFHGMVFQGQQSPRTDKIVACKAFTFGHKWSNDRVFALRRKSFQTEVAVLKHVSHPHIVKWISTFQIYCEENDTSRNFNLSVRNDEAEAHGKTLLLSGFLMEKLDMDLRQWMTYFNKERLTELQVRLVFEQIGSALHYLHSEHQICQQDLKPANIGVKLNGDSRHPRLVLLDFGNAEIYSQNEFLLAQHHSQKYKLDIEAVLQSSSNLKKSSADWPFKMAFSLHDINAFLREANQFALLLMMLASFDLDCRNSGTIRANFAHQCHFVESRLKALLLRVGTAQKNELVSMEWAMNRLANG